MGTGEYLFTVAGNKFWCSQCGNSVQCPQKARNRSTIWLGYTYSWASHHRNLDPIILTALFTISRDWEESACPSTNEWAMKMCYPYTMDNSSSIKKKEIMNFTGKWIEPQIITLKEETRAQRDKCHKLSVLYRCYYFLDKYVWIRILREIITLVSRG